jgi:hypothetical protein
VDEPPTGKVLVGEEANRWARAVAFARSKPTGGRLGVRRDGVVAAIKLARSKAQDNAQYHRGTRCRTLPEAILNASMEKFAGRAPDSIAAADLAALKAAVKEWFSLNTDIALVGIQLVVASNHSRNMARITGRTSRLASATCIGSDRKPIAPDTGSGRGKDCPVDFSTK